MSKAASHPLASLSAQLMAALGLTALAPSACTTPSTTLPEDSGGGGGGASAATDGAKGSNVTTTTGQAIPEVPPVEVACSGAQAIKTPAGNDTGYARCSDGRIARAGAATFEVIHASSKCAGSEDHLQCRKDADCKDGANGACMTYRALPSGGTGCTCAYSCTSDTDCAPTQVCVPPQARGEGAGRSMCVDTLCKTSADCGGDPCLVSKYFDGCSTEYKLACAKADAECQVASDCPRGDCAWDDKKATWTCQSMGCVIGRPFVVAGVTRTAARAPRARADDAWSSDARAIGAPAVSREARALAAEHWLDCAMLEHASVASFSRFSLQLMSLGAPPALLAAAHEASGDEIRHAQICFGIARDLMGTGVGPGAMDLSGVDLSVDLDAFVALLVQEACIGETIAAADAAVAAQAACEPIATHLRTIADDETRHAALGWQTLHWLLARSDARTRRRIAASVHAGLAQAERAAPAPMRHAVGAEALGVSTPEVREATRREVLRTIVRPCAEALLSDAARSVKRGEAVDAWARTGLLA